VLLWLAVTVLDRLVTATLTVGRAGHRPPRAGSMQGWWSSGTPPAQCAARAGGIWDDTVPMCGVRTARCVRPATPGATRGRAAAVRRTPGSAPSPCWVRSIPTTAVVPTPGGPRTESLPESGALTEDAYDRVECRVTA